MVLVWEYLFCDVDLHFVVVILHLSSFVDVFHFVVVSSFDFQATLPFDHHSTLASQTREASTSSELYPDYFWLPFLFHLPRALWFWVGIFYFTLLPNILAQPAFIKVSLGAGSYVPEICRTSYWSSKHRPGPSACWIYSNPQSSILLNLCLYMSILQKFYLWWELW